MKPWPHQIELSKQGFDILREYGLVYLNMEERTGKTLIAILMAEDSVHVRKAAVITTKKAVKDWNETLKAYNPKVTAFEVINYHSAHKLSIKPDLVILDEAHNYISGFPKRSSIWDKVNKITRDLPIIYSSATCSAQGRHLLYNQLALSSWSPFSNFRNYYEWHREYGIPNMLYLHGRYIENWDKCDNERVWNEVKHIFITKTRKELGFEKEPEDVIHYIELNPVTKEVYNELLKEKMCEFKCGLLIADTSMKLRTALHSIEGGTLITKNDFDKPIYNVLGNTEKVDYILNTWGDTENLVIMYNYKAEKIKLEKYFKNALLLQATSYAEGIDLHKYKHLVIYSQDFRTAKHSQRRARQANKDREEDIKVHFLLVKKAISDQVYKTVSLNKINFVDSVFEEEELQ